jgi:hypothetical protein
MCACTYNIFSVVLILVDRRLVLDAPCIGRVLERVDRLLLPPQPPPLQMRAAVTGSRIEARSAGGSMRKHTHTHRHTPTHPRTHTQRTHTHARTHLVRGGGRDARDHHGARVAAERVLQQPRELGRAERHVRLVRRELLDHLPRGTLCGSCARHWCDRCAWHVV